jgi:hypothetical protein
MRERGKTVKLIIGTFLLLSMGTASYGAMVEREGGGGGFGKPAVTPNSQIKVHDVGKIWLTISNYATFANPHDTPDPRNPDALAPSCMFPGGSNLEYLFSGFLWIGARRDTVIGGISARDTVVSVGGDGWESIDSEMWPDFPPNGDIIIRSTRPPDVYPYGDTVDAISEQDFISVFTDTKTDPQYVPTDPYDGKPHRPLGLEVTQKSFAWSYEYAEDFVLFDYDIVNIGNRNLQDVWLALYIDADVWHTSENPYGAEEGAQDDICGFVDSVITSVIDADTTRMGIFTAYIADNDGQVYDGAFDSYLSPRGVSGVRVVRTPIPDLQYGFNWWISNVDANFDWGPMTRENLDLLLPDTRLPSGGLGTPGPDWSKYFIMSNGEFDYDQIFCDLPFWSADSGWIEKSDEAADLANGYDTRYLFSFGPFPSISPGDTLKLTTAYVCGEYLHVDPSNYSRNLETSTGDAGAVQEYYNTLDFQDFATNSQWAEWVYDNPGVDTDTTDTVGGPGWWVEGEHFIVTPEGDTTWFKGDGVPDFAGPPPPPSPRLTAETSPGVVTLNWDGSETETTEDNFSNEVDFEGYRIYMSRTGRLGEYMFLADIDIIDYDSTYLDSTVSPPLWRLWKEPPRPLEAFYDPLVIDPPYPSDFDPDTSENWVPNGWNSGLESMEVEGADKQYTYTRSGLSESVGMYFAVTAYDFGNPVTNLSPLESSQTINAKYVYAIAKGDLAGEVAVYPNPYKITGNYAELGYEDPDQSGFTEFDRRIMFAGLPPRCSIRIFTLDGDLVRKVDHDDSTSPEGPGVNYWDLISRNTQAVVSGIYIYSIDGDDGYHQLGKIVIIK